MTIAQPFTQFPQITPYYVPLTPAWDPTGTGCWRVIFPRTQVPVNIPANAGSANSDGYFPIAAVYLKAVGCQPPGCFDVMMFLNDCVSRATFGLNAFHLDDPAPYPTLPTEVDWQVRAGLDAITNAVFSCSTTIDWTKTNATPQPAEIKGPIATVSGVLCTQFELWARVQSNPGVLSTPNLSVRVEIAVDRLGNQLGAHKYPLAGGTDLPNI